MNEVYQQELQDETGILILCDKNRTQEWKEDGKGQLKKENETQVEDTTNKLYQSLKYLKRYNTYT